MNPFTVENPFVPTAETQRDAETVQRMLDEGAALIDVRELEEFAEARLPGAVALPMSEIRNRWQEIPDDVVVVLYCRSGNRSGQIASTLRARAGYTQIYNLAGGIQEWFARRLPVDTSPVELTYQETPFEEIDVLEAQRRFSEQGHLLVDVRESFEFDLGHAVGAINIPLSELDDAVAALRSQGPILLICNSGNRSGMAAEWLQEEGFDAIANVEGGIIAWQAHQLPWER